MDCKEFEELIPGLLKSKSRGKRREEAFAHQKSCKSCTRAWEANSEMKCAGPASTASPIDLACREGTSPVTHVAYTFIEEAIKQSANGILIEPAGEQIHVMFRIGEKVEEFHAIPSYVGNALPARLKLMANLDALNFHYSQKGNIWVRLGDNDYHISLITK